MANEFEMYAGIEGKILVFQSTNYHKHAYFYRIVRQTPKTVVVQALGTTVLRVHIRSFYRDVVPNEEPPFGKLRRMFKTFEQPCVVKGYVDDSTKYLELWDGSHCTEAPMCPICNKNVVCRVCGSINTKKVISDFDGLIYFFCYDCRRKSFPYEEER